MTLPRNACISDSLLASRFSPRKRISPPVKQAIGLGSSPSTEKPVTDLAAARLADQTQDLVLAHAQVHAVERLDHAAQTAKLEPQVADLEQIVGGHQRFILGSSTSRSPSPTKLKASTRAKMARPGNVPIHHCCRM